jgi:hypothetical protein
LTIAFLHGQTFHPQTKNQYYQEVMVYILPILASGTVLATAMCIQEPYRHLRAARKQGGKYGS